MACPALRWGVHLLTFSDNHQGRALPIHVVGAACRDPAVEAGFLCKAELPSRMGTASYLPMPCYVFRRHMEERIVEGPRAAGF